MVDVLNNWCTSVLAAVSLSHQTIVRINPSASRSLSCHVSIYSFISARHTIRALSQNDTSVTCFPYIGNRQNASHTKWHLKIVPMGFHVWLLFQPTEYEQDTLHQNTLKVKPFSGLSFFISLSNFFIALGYPLR